MVLVGLMFSVVLILTLLVLAALSRQLRAPIGAGLAAAGCEESEPIVNYEPMARLLSPGDLEFLRQQPGYTKKMESQFRSERCRLFRVYLRSLRADFRRTCSTLKQVMLQAQADRPDLAALLLRSQFHFTYGVALAQVNVLFYEWGIGNVDCSAVLEPFRGVRAALESFTPAAVGAGA